MDGISLEEYEDNITDNKRQTIRFSRQDDFSKRLKLLKECLLSPPNVESLYCAASSTKLYLESRWTTPILL